MKIHWRFTVHPAEISERRIHDVCYVKDPILYRKLFGIVEPSWKRSFGHPAPPGESHSFIPVDLAEDDPMLIQVVELVRQAGWEPYLGTNLSNDLINSHFQVRRIRHFEAKDFRNAEYFHITRWSDLTFVADYVGMQDCHLVCRVAKAKWKTRYGYAKKRPFYPRLVNGELKEALEQAGLRGLTFQRILFDQPDKAKGTFWDVYSSLSMPRSHLPMYRTNVTGENGNVEVRLYDDGGHHPIELVYDRQEVAAMEPFDAALTSPEEMGHSDLHASQRDLIVSAKCRKVMLTQLRMTSVQFTPVHLVVR
jgi:hypothetical protein